MPYGRIIFYKIKVSTTSSLITYTKDKMQYDKSFIGDGWNMDMHTELHLTHGIAIVIKISNKVLVS